MRLSHNTQNKNKTRKGSYDLILVRSNKIDPAAVAWAAHWAVCSNPKLRRYGLTTIHTDPRNPSFVILDANRWSESQWAIIHTRATSAEAGTTAVPRGITMTETAAAAVGRATV